jgi:hypothetical protein
LFAISVTNELVCFFIVFGVKCSWPSKIEMRFRFYIRPTELVESGEWLLRMTEPGHIHYFVPLLQRAVDLVQWTQCYSCWFHLFPNLVIS